MDALIAVKVIIVVKVDENGLLSSAHVNEFIRKIHRCTVAVQRRINGCIDCGALLWSKSMQVPYNSKISQGNDSLGPD